MCWQSSMAEFRHHLISKILCLDCYDRASCLFLQSSASSKEHDVELQSLPYLSLLLKVMLQVLSILTFRYSNASAAGSCILFKVLQGAVSGLHYPPESMGAALSGLFLTGSTSDDAFRTKLRILLYALLDCGHNKVMPSFGCSLIAQPHRSKCLGAIICSPRTSNQQQKSISRTDGGLVYLHLHSTIY